MSRPRSRPLPPGIYERRLARGRRSYWISFTDADGVRVRELGGSSVEEAVRALAQRRGDAAAGLTRSSGSPTQALRTYAERWVDLRRREGVRTVGREEQLLADYVLPVLGKKPLAEIRPRDVAAWVRGLSAAGDLAPKSIRNAHGVLSALLARARFDELVVDNAARGLPRGILPDAQRAREVGAWTRAELERWITPHPEVPEDRTVAYAIAAFTGARVGEISGLRWRDIDMRSQPLWRWALRTQYDDAPLKTERPRDIPIHAELARILAAWKLGGWARFMCRVRSEDDLVVPRNPHLRTGRPQHAHGQHHSSSSLGAKAVRRHAQALGIDDAGRDFHSFRRAMITLARTDGARAEVLERVTHNSRGEMIDGYTYFGWDVLCSAVQVLRIAPLVESDASVTRLVTRSK